MPAAEVHLYRPRTDTTLEVNLTEADLDDAVRPDTVNQYIREHFGTGWEISVVLFGNRA